MRTVMKKWSVTLLEILTGFRKVEMFLKLESSIIENICMCQQCIYIYFFIIN